MIWWVTLIVIGLALKAVVILWAWRRSRDFDDWARRAGFPTEDDD